MATISWFLGKRQHDDQPVDFRGYSGVFKAISVLKNRTDGILSNPCVVNQKALPSYIATSSTSFERSPWHVPSRAWNPNCLGGVKHPCQKHGKQASHSVKLHHHFTIILGDVACGENQGHSPFV